MGVDVVTVEMATLGHLLKQHQIAWVDLLKIDVEGAELDVLLGLDGETWPRVRQVVVETHNRDGRQTQIERLLTENGFHQIAIAQQRTIDNGLSSVILTARRESDAPPHREESSGTPGPPVPRRDASWLRHATR